MAPTKAAVEHWTGRYPLEMALPQRLTTVSQGDIPGTPSRLAGMAVDNQVQLFRSLTIAVGHQGMQ